VRAHHDDVGGELALGGLHGERFTVANPTGLPIRSVFALHVNKDGTGRFAHVDRVDAGATRAIALEGAALAKDEFVRAISAKLEESLERTGSEAIHAIRSDLTAFADHVPVPADTILCMGDTLTHLADRGHVQRLLDAVGAALRPGGVFMTTFRDYTVELEGVDRFLPVRSDPDRVLTVFLEYRDETVVVHDLLHERQGDHWSLQASSYPKLRLAPAWVAGVLRDRNLAVDTSTGHGGLVQIVARRP
jgi:SAM-dependent methyltransferase